MNIIMWTTDHKLDQVSSFALSLFLTVLVVFY